MTAAAKTSVEVKRPVAPALWGSDHLSTLLYLESRAVDYEGRLDKRHMRCDPRRHPGHAHDGTAMGPPSPTRLYGGVELPDHDDWDCIDDLEAERLVSDVGTGLNPRPVLTDRGWNVVHALRRARARARDVETVHQALLEALKAA